MNLEVYDIEKAKEDEDTDLWLSLRYTNYHVVENAYISWEVPVSKEELKSLWRSLPKKIKDKATKLGFGV